MYKDVSPVLRQPWFTCHKENNALMMLNTLSLEQNRADKVFVYKCTPMHAVYKCRTVHQMCDLSLQDVGTLLSDKNECRCMIFEYQYRLLSQSTKSVFKFMVPKK